jgi:hypothetical protein
VGDAERASVLAKNILGGIGFVAPCVKTGQSPHGLLTPDAINFRVWLVQTLREMVNDLKPRCGWQMQRLLNDFIDLPGDLPDG